MKIYVHRRQPGQVAAWLRDAGFTIEAQVLLDPDAAAPGAALFARRPYGTAPTASGCGEDKTAGR